MNTSNLHQETHLQVLRLLETNPQLSQRELAAALGVSLGKTNFCLRALLDKGLVKVQNFQNNKQNDPGRYYREVCAYQAVFNAQARRV